MSYEGYAQILCKNGHLSTPDAYDPHYPDGMFGVTTEEWKCSVCNEKLAWINHVDETNGVYCTNPDCDVDNDWCEYCEEGRIDNYIQLELVEELQYCICTDCGNKHLVNTPKYKIPE